MDVLVVIFWCDIELLGAVIHVHDFNVIKVHFRKFFLALLDQIFVAADAGKLCRIFKANLNFIFLDFRGLTLRKLFDVYIVVHAKDTEEVFAHLLLVVVEFGQKLGFRGRLYKTCLSVNDCYRRRREDTLDICGWSLLDETS